MKEIEVKIFDIDVDKITKQLEDAGAEVIFDGRIDAIQFDFEDFALRKKGSQARIRRIGEKVEMVTKGPRDGFTREEIETFVDDFETARLIFNRLGLVEMCRYKKHRKSYELDGIKFEFDTYPNFPTFLEVEAKSEDDVKRGVEMIGCTMEQTFPRGILVKWEELGVDPEENGFELSENYTQWRSAK